jgi:signal transduction histidine kinase
MRVVRARRDLLLDVLLAALFATAAQLDVWVQGTVPGPRLTSSLLLALVAPPLVLRRRWPCAALLAIAAAVTAQRLVVGHSPSGFLFWPLLAGAYSVGAYASWSRRVLFTLVAFYAAYVFMFANQLDFSFTALVPELLWTLLPAALWLAGRQMRRRRRTAAGAAEATRLELEHRQERVAALERERGKMARELHDILAHSVSLMGVQAGAAEEVLAHDPERARPVLRSIQQTSRDSVAELRRLLNMLRAEELQPELGPQPDLDQLGALVQRMHEAGLPIELTIEGTARPLPAGVELTAYRVVQEALTNALKHARPTKVEVVIRYSPRQLDLLVCNDGIAHARNGNGNGHGLIGMNERVSLYGGRLQAGSLDPSEFRVHAEIPLEDAPA